MSVISFCGYNLFSFAPWFVLGPVIAKQHLGGAGPWGLILAAGGVGSVLGGVAGLRVKPTHPLLVEQSLCLLWSSQLLLLAVVAPVPAVMAVAVAGGTGLTLANTLWYTALQSKIPEHAISRVSSYDDLGSFVINPLSLVLIGPLAAALGTERAILVCAAGSFGSLAFALATPAIRHLTLASAQDAGAATT